MSNKTLERRNFLKLAGLTGFALSSPLAGKAFAQQAEPGSYDGPLLLTVHCGGGWDPTSFCDPKGRLSEEQVDPMNRYLADDIRSPDLPSDITWAPFGENEDFFSRHWDKLLVINGIDTSTNGHSQGTRHIFSGKLEEGHPAITALVAAIHGNGLPLGFITNGGYDVTRGTVARTRLGNLSAIQRISQPNRWDSRSSFHTEETMSRILATHKTRLDGLIGKQKLPRVGAALANLKKARGSENELSRLTSNLPDLDNFNTGLGDQAAIAIAGYKAGLTVSANLSTGGFDTHGDHDNRQGQALTRLTRGLNEIWQEVERHGLEEKVLIAVGSDFGRTPGYNAGNGKDHWSITSMIFMGGGITGNRVIGETTYDHRPLKVNPETLEVDEQNGIILRPSHVHLALRKRFGVLENILAREYPISGEDLALFG